MHEQNSNKQWSLPEPDPKAGAAAAAGAILIWMLIYGVWVLVVVSP
jgi:hypothetical protein